MTPRPLATEELAVQAREALAGRLDAPTLRRAPASVAAVTHHGAVVSVHTHGEPRRDGAATAPGTVFRIASMSLAMLDPYHFRAVPVNRARRASRSALRAAFRLAAAARAAALPVPSSTIPLVVSTSRAR